MSIADINNASTQINRYCSVGLILFGCIGNTLNCVVFLQRPLRTNPCAVYFLVASLSSIIAVVSGLLPRMLSGWNIIADLTETDPILCKLRLTVLFITRCIPPWLIVLATIDRYLISSSDVNVRNMSNLKQAYRWIIITCITSILLWAEAVYCYDANLIGTPLKCYAKSDVCREYNDLSQSLIIIIIPSIIMFIFGLRTIKNLRQLRRLMPSNTNTSSKRIENSLTKMLFIQIILLTACNMPQAVQKFYATQTFYQPKSLFQITVENFIFGIFLILSFVPYCVSFYFFIFGNLFQESFIRIGQKILRQFQSINREIYF
jgi:hypothetical protein